VRLRQVEAADVHRIDARDPLRAVGDVHRTVEVVHEDPDDFTEAERHDRQVVAAQAQRRRAEQDPEGRRQRHGDRHDDQRDERRHPLRQNRGQQHDDRAKPE